GHPHYEVVLSVAIIAIARKVIILDINEVSSGSLIGIASIIVALTAGYFLMKIGQSKENVN
ncbi:MAG: phosphate-starvation-inducible PsiE family protein, partial [Deltaproteobacteria bacterium]|nr:phosphate-starvation-inducible PsiE family protein [Deltaproteobacteria bacterium]